MVGLGIEVCFGLEAEVEAVVGAKGIEGAPGECRLSRQCSGRAKEIREAGRAQGVWICGGSCLRRL